MPVKNPEENKCLGD